MEKCFVCEMEKETTMINGCPICEEHVEFFKEFKHVMSWRAGRIAAG